MLGNRIKDRKKIYLDTKFWVDFCDIALKKKNNENIKNVYDICKKLVNEKKAIFPISYRIFIELIKQTDKESLLQTVEIIDTLSQGVTIISEDERVDLEILYFLRSHIQKSDLYEPTELVWTKISNIMGVLSPELPLLSYEENIDVKIRFFDHIWDMSLYKMISTMGMDGIKRFPKSDGFADILNRGKFEHLEQNNTIHKTYMSEIDGILDINESRINNSLKYLKEENKSSTTNMDEILKTSKSLIERIYDLFNKQKNELFLASWDIMAKVHTTIRWNKERKYRDNDSHDIGHIVTALPYFDYFFTEKSFASLITQIKYDQKYNCHVAWKYDEVLEIVNVIYKNNKDKNDAE